MAVHQFRIMEETIWIVILKMAKTVLIISYYYPPMKSGGAQRPASFAKYLQDYDYNPVVVTSQVAGAAVDEEHVVRVRDPAAALTDKVGIKSLTFRFYRKALFWAGMIPGSYYWWYKEARHAELSIVENHRPDIILATFPPEENLIIGMDISGKYNIPLVLDFRDGMAFETVVEAVSFWAMWKLKGLEQRLVNSATRIITVSGPLTDYFNEHYPGRKASTITNGFDPEEWKNIKKIDLGEKINIVYTGQVKCGRRSFSLKSLVEAIHALPENEKGRICLHMVGNFSRQERAFMQNAANADLFRLVGFVDRNRAPAIPIFSGPAFGGHFARPAQRSDRQAVRIPGRRQTDIRAYPWVRGGGNNQQDRHRHLRKPR